MFWDFSTHIRRVSVTRKGSLIIKIHSHKARFYSRHISASANSQSGFYGVFQQEGPRWHFYSYHQLPSLITVWAEPADQHCLCWVVWQQVQLCVCVVTEGGHLGLQPASTERVKGQCDVRRPNLQTLQTQYRHRVNNSVNYSSPTLGWSKKNIVFNLRKISLFFGGCVKDRCILVQILKKQACKLKHRVWNK